MTEVANNLMYPYSSRNHPSAEEVAKRAEDILSGNSLLQSRAFVSFCRQDVETYLTKSGHSLMYKSRFRSGNSFLDHHPEWVLHKFSLVPREIEVFSYYSCDLGVPLRICGLYNTRVEVKWLNNSMKITEEPSTWLQIIDTEGPLPRKLYYGDGFRYEV